MKTVNYLRSDVYTYYELTDEQKKSVDTWYEHDEDNNVFFVDSPTDENDALPLNNFMRVERSFFADGIYGQSYFSAYFVKLSKCGTQAVVSYRYE